MYSRYSQKDETFQIPEHYSGCAFPTQKNRSAAPLPRTPSSFLEVGKPVTPPPPSPSEKVEIIQDPPREESPSPNQSAKSVSIEKEPDEQTKSAFAPLPKLLGNLGSAFPFTHGLGFEELLILGLIILLSRNEEESDLILLLGLLLFCG